MKRTVEFLSADVQAELDDLPIDIRASFERVVHLIEVAGLERVHEPYVKHLEGSLYRCRKARGGCPSVSQEDAEDAAS